MSQQTDYRADIDGLRAGAVLLVIGYHFFPNRFPGGYVGVDIFFVISGFLITGILLQDLERKDFSIARFYGRRIRRIFPAWVTILLFLASLIYEVIAHNAQRLPTTSGGSRQYFGQASPENGHYRMPRNSPLLHAGFCQILW